MPEELSSTERAYIMKNAGSAEGSKNFGAAGGMWGGIVGGIDGYFGGPMYKAHMKRMRDWYTYPTLDELELNSPTAGLDKWLEQVPYSDRLNKILELLNSKDNAQFQRTISSADPNLIRNAGQFGANNAAYLRGEIPKDVLDQVSRTAAYKSLAGGYGGSQMASALKARDFGLTSLDLQKRGGDALQQQFALAMALNPQHQTSMDMFTSAQDLLQRDDRQTTYNNSIANQQKALDFASNLAIKGGGAELLNATIGGMYGGGGGGRVNYNQQNQNQNQDWTKMLMSMFGGGGGASAGAGVGASGSAGYFGG